MTDLIQSLLKRTTSLILIIGFLVLLVGTTDELGIGTFSIGVASNTARVVLVVLGLVLFLLGIYLALSERQRDVQSHGTAEGQIKGFRIWETRDSRGRQGG